MPEERLQKILSQAGVASRRKAEELIVQGRVSVNGQTVDTLGAKADLESDHIKVDGQPLRAPKNHLYIALNKPKGCVTTTADPEGRETVMHLLRGIKGRVFPVGRLDYNSEGLLLFTNDGEFAHKVTAPESHIKKTYVAKVNGVLTEDQENQFREGIPMHGRKTSPAELKRIKGGDNPWYEVRITEGRQNQIRIMFKHFGRLVEKLRRVKIAFLELDVAPGRYRMLTHKEVERFQKLLKLEAAEEPPSDHEIRAGLVPKVKAKPTEAAIAPAETADFASKPTGKPAFVAKPAGKPAFVSKPAGKPAFVAKQSGRPAMVSKPGAKPATFAPKPAGRPAFVAKPSGRPAMDPKLAGRPALVRKPAGKPTGGAPKAWAPKTWAPKAAAGGAKPARPKRKFQPGRQRGKS